MTEAAYAIHDLGGAHRILLERMSKDKHIIHTGNSNNKEPDSNIKEPDSNNKEPNSNNK